MSLAMRLRCVVAGCALLVSLPCAAQQDRAPSRADADRLFAAAAAAEIAGDDDARLARLQEILSVSPDDPLAHWQLGQILVADKWKPASDVAQGQTDSPFIAEYEQLRRSVPMQEDAHAKLSQWCAAHDLPEQAEFHARVAERLKNRGRRTKVRRVRAEKAPAQKRVAQQRAGRQQPVQRPVDQLQKWRAPLLEIRQQFASTEKRAKERARASLLAIDDPSVVIPAEAMLSSTNSPAALASVKTIARFHTLDATRSLIRHAIFASQPAVREVASQTLKDRPIYCWAQQMIETMRAPIAVTSLYSLSGDGESFSMSLYQSGPFVDQLLGYSGNTIVINAGAPGGNRAAAVYQTESNLARQMANASVVIDKVQQFNSTAETINKNVADTLSLATGRPPDTDVTTWYRWWYEFNEYPFPAEKRLISQSYSDPTQVIVSYVAPPIYRTDPPPSPTPPPPPRSRFHSCFVKGTLVTTASGIRPIETIRQGERVLSQNVDTGELAFQPVLVTTHGDPLDMLQINAEGERMFLTRGHVLWVSGKGWKMAKEIEPGDQLHTLAGPAKVEAVEFWSQAETYNLVVANFNTYFVSERQFLVHDITFRAPTAAIVPGVIGAAMR